ncbi:MAG: amino acid ABC transporter substrate-binding protein [Alphaproteobacteria bacterium]|nr:amino acid ABC transporter substrate-binding protein [Alphaproteobacteria bacterium]
MKKVLIVLFVIICVVAVGYNAYQSKQQVNEGKRKVYVVVQLTGPIAEAGKHVKAAMDSWMEMHPDASFDLVYVDNESRPDKAVTGIQQKTINDDHPITITIGSIFANVVFPVMKNREGFNFSIITFNPIVEGYSNAQNLSYSLNDVVQPIANKINQNYQSVAIVSSLDEFGEQQKNYLIKHLNSDIQVYSVAFPANQQDIRLETQKLLMNNPDAVVILMTPGIMYQNVLKELKNNFSGRIIADLAFENKFLNEVVKDLNMDVEAIISKTNIHNKQLSEFEQKLANKNSYLSYTTKQSYDSLSIIDYFMKNNLSFTQNVFKQLGSWSGMNNITFLGDGKSSIEYELIPFKNGQFDIIESGEK